MPFDGRWEISPVWGQKRVLLVLWLHFAAISPCLTRQATYTGRAYTRQDQATSRLWLWLCLGLLCNDPWGL